MNAVRGLSVTVGLTFAWALSIWANNVDEFSRADSSAFALHCFVVLLVQSIVYVVLYRVARTGMIPGFIPRLTNSSFCVFNLYSLTLMHYQTVAGMPPGFVLLLLLGLLAIFFVAFNMIETAALSPKLLYALIGILILYTAGEFFWHENERQKTMATISEIPEHFTFPEFIHKPNVYLVSFDALIPEAISKRFLNIREREYVSALREEGLRVLKNVFVERVPTNPAINSLVAMDLTHYESLPEIKKFLFDTGEIPGPLYELFRRNSYKIQFAYKTPFFGSLLKSTLDAYLVETDRGICYPVSGGGYALMGYCMRVDAKIKDRQLAGRKYNYPDLLFERIKQIAQSSDRWLTVAYIYSPGHTKLGFSPYRSEDFAEYREELTSRGDAMAAAYIRELIRTIRDNDPEAILVIFGDHGAMMSRGLPVGDLPEDSPFTATDVFLERHAVVAAVYPREFCTDEFKELFTITRVGRSIVKCLSGGIDPLPPEYQANDDHYLEYQYE